MKTTSFHLFGLLMLILSSVHGQGIVVVQHSGANNPTGEGFNLLAGSGNATAPVFSDLRMNAWMITNSPTVFASYDYDFSSSQQMALTGSDWVLSITIRMLSGEYGQYVDFDNGSGIEAGFTFGINNQGQTYAGNPMNPLFVSASTVPSYYNFQLRYTGAAGLGSFWVNGIEINNNVNNIALFYVSGLPFLRWGGDGGQTPGNSQVNWNLVSLQIIPEPSVWALAGMGGLLLAARRLRHARKI